MNEHEANKLLRNVHVAIAHLDRIDQPTDKQISLLLKCLGDLVIVRDRWTGYVPRKPEVDYNAPARHGRISVEN